MNTRSFIEKLRYIGISIVPNGNELDIYDPNEMLTEDLVKILRDKKKEIFNLIGDIGDKKVKFTERLEYIPLSESQKKIYLLHLLNPGTTLYNTPKIIELPRECRYEDINFALTALMTRHHLLRSVLVMIDNVPFLKIASVYKLNLRYKILADDFLEQYFNNSIVPIDLTESLFRAQFIETHNKAKFLLIDFHHLIIDAQSISILQIEFIKLLKGELLPPIGQYYDFTKWEMSLEKSGLNQQDRVFWKANLADRSEVSRIPYDFIKTDISLSNSGLHRFKLYDDVKAIRKFCGQHGYLISALILTLLKIFINKVTGKNDILLGLVASQRENISFEGVVGPLINTIPLRIILDESKGADTLVKIVNKAIFECRKHQNYQFQDFTDHLRKDNSSLFETIFNFLDSNTVTTPFSKNHINLESAKYDIVFHVHCNETDIELGIEYRTRYYDPKSILLYSQYLRYLFSQIIDKPDLLLSKMALVSKDALPEIQSLLNTPAGFATDTSIIDLFNKTVSKNQDRIAVVYEDEQISYGDLSRQSDKICAALLSTGVSGNCIIGICLSPSISQIISILGVLKSGCAYLPIDSALPQERVKFMIEDSQTRFLIADDLGNNFKIDDLTILNFKELILDPVSDCYYKQSKISTYDIAYLIYTSGTTGRPKGVLVDHRNVIRLFFTKPALYKFDIQDVWTLFHSYSFDFSVWEIFGALLSGACLVIIPLSHKNDTTRYLRALHIFQVTILNQTPSVFYRLSHLVTEFKTVKLAVRLVIFGGEELSPRMLINWRGLFPKCKLVNMYGITETTVHVTYREVVDSDIHNNTSIIGKPIPTTRCILLDHNLNVVPPGVIGELCVAGDGLARGYLNNPELTSERFIQHSIEPSSVWYRSGDMAKYTVEGDLYYVGRNDNQIQLRGFRVELKEIESTILKYPKVINCFVAVNGNNDSIIAYVVSKFVLESDEILEYLKLKLPTYMLPSFIIVTDTIPVTSNGKVDKARLPSTLLNQNKQELQVEFQAELFAIFSKVLAIPESQVSLEKTFFELGGNSLNIMDLGFEIRRQLALAVEIRDLFKYNCIGKLSNHLKGLNFKKSGGFKKGESKEYYPLSHSQNRVLVLEKIANNGVLICNIPMIFRIDSVLNEVDLKASFNLLIERHEALRTGFYFIDNHFVQRIHNTVAFALETEVTELSGCSNIIQKFIRPFDLAKPPLIRAKFLTITSTCVNYIIIDMHHIISDWITVNQLKKELIDILGKKVLTPVLFQYTDYVSFERSKTFERKMSKHLDYWRSEFSDGIPRLVLPKDYHQHLTRRDYKGDNFTFVISDVQLDTIRSLARRNNVTTYSIFLATYYIMLLCLSGQNDIVVGITVTGRTHHDLKAIAGVFTNMIPLRIKMNEAYSLVTLAQEVQNKVSSGLNHQDYPYDTLVQEIGKPQGIDELFKVGFSLLNEAENVVTKHLYDNVLEDAVKKHHRISHSEFLFYGVEFANRTIFTVEYIPNIYSEETILSFTKLYMKILFSDPLATIAAIASAEEGTWLKRSTTFPSNIKFNF